MSIELRKKPKQARSLERFNNILDHAEKMIQSAGVNGFKISELARHADVNIATIYQYFPNQPSLLRHLMEKNIDALIAFIEASGCPSEGGLDAMIHRIVDTHLDFCLKAPVFLQLRGVSQANHDLHALSVSDTYRIVDLFIPAAMKCVPRASELRVKNALFIGIEMCMHLLQLSLSVEGAERERIINQTRLVMNLYLETLA